MLSDERIDELSAGALVEMGTRPRLAALDAVGRVIRAAVAEAVAANDKAWQWQLNNPNSDAHMMKAAHVRLANREAVAVEREAFVKLIEADDDDWLFDFETQTAIPLDRVRAIHFALKKIVAAIRARGEEQ